jgi:hypothetical protein
VSRRRPCAVCGDKTDGGSKNEALCWRCIRWLFRSWRRETRRIGNPDYALVLWKKDSTLDRAVLERIDELTDADWDSDWMKDLWKSV